VTVLSLSAITTIKLRLASEVRKNPYENSGRNCNIIAMSGDQKEVSEKPNVYVHFENKAMKGAD
jgi:hypothetical protein